MTPQALVKRSPAWLTVHVFVRISRNLAVRSEWRHLNKIFTLDHWQPQTFGRNHVTFCYQNWACCVSGSVVPVVCQLPWHAVVCQGSCRHIHYSDVIMGAMASQINSLTIVCSTVYSGADQRKHQSSESLAFVRGIYRWPVNSPHKWPGTRKCFHSMTLSCWWWRLGPMYTVFVHSWHLKSSYNHFSCNQSFLFNPMAGRGSCVLGVITFCDDIS